MDFKSIELQTPSKSLKKIFIILGSWFGFVVILGFFITFIADDFLKFALLVIYSALVIFLTWLFLKAAIVIPKAPQYGLVRTFGKPTSVLEPGFHIVIPFIQRVSMVTTSLFVDRITFKAILLNGVSVNFDLVYQTGIRPEAAAIAAAEIMFGEDVIIAVVNAAIAEVANFLKKVEAANLPKELPKVEKALTKKISEKFSDIIYPPDPDSGTSFTLANPDYPEELDVAMARIEISRREIQAAEEKAKMEKNIAEMLSRAADDYGVDPQQKPALMAQLRQNILVSDITSGSNLNTIVFSGAGGIQGQEMFTAGVAVKDGKNKDDAPPIAESDKQK